MVVPPNYLPQFWQQSQLSGVQLAQSFGKRLEIPWPHSPVLKCHRMTTSQLTYLDQKLSILQNRIWFDDDWQNCLVALFQFAPVCVFLRRFAPVLHFFALVYPMWISWQVPNKLQISAKRPCGPSTHWRWLLRQWVGSSPLGLRCGHRPGWGGLNGESKPIWEPECTFLPCTMG